LSVADGRQDEAPSVSDSHIDEAGEGLPHMENGTNHRYHQ